ncbi:hypothetical protein VKT23_019221 [Stygiomarasmius scandens]|uniref:Uncharacterized protein n=1 Tax=Marasmiellus scandens TaxID=2682957 RepID=A0ABR1INH9_9AGAR
MATNESFEVVLAKGDVDVDAEDIEIAEVLGSDGKNGNASNLAHEAHDTAVSKSIRDIAIWEMRSKGVVISDCESKDALKVFPKVAGLAKKVHDSGTVGTAFEKAVNSEPGITSQFTALAQRNATRWGSERRCLQTYQELWPAVNKILADKDLKLASYKLNTAQERMIKELRVLLDAHDEVIKAFQYHNRPLIIDVIPAFEDLQHILLGISSCDAFLAVTHVASYAT